MWSCCTNKTKKIKEAFEPFTYKICTDSVIISADVAYKKEKLLFERVRKKTIKIILMYFLKVLNNNSAF